MSFEAFDVVVVPFPFTDRSTTKRRPALVLSSSEIFSRPTVHAVLAMITSARNSTWPLDTEIQDLDAAGLPATSIVRMKLFTLDERLIIRQAGRLEQDDRRRVIRALTALMPAIVQ
ncbi:type II toxin-antitoxin system PemK/MazF family toxin [Halomonas sp. TRM85114]|uniref:type II toxin-antitoxin system PemK/MazF family toxin n=1 Tax=Halomonas jincaotanensis TaxID=2810616 RepID=UPI001BD5F989|nr:type II toxin-antitoxin system PemK/MazF family toxin [Halomonas jincaotanensis]MBS9403517.1 type II toxin-antitoxin system PemK/MazF family toxin [Halomonas jincaotanensis]